MEDNVSYDKLIAISERAKETAMLLMMSADTVDKTLKMIESSDITKQEVIAFSMEIPLVSDAYDKTIEACDCLLEISRALNTSVDEIYNILHNIM